MAPQKGHHPSRWYLPSAPHLGKVPYGDYGQLQSHSQFIAWFLPTTVWWFHFIIFHLNFNLSQVRLPKAWVGFPNLKPPGENQAYQREPGDSWGKRSGRALNAMAIAMDGPWRDPWLGKKPRCGWRFPNDFLWCAWKSGFLHGITSQMAILKANMMVKLVKHHIWCNYVSDKPIFTAMFYSG